jgi:carnitine O-octanoyltransferase
MIEASENQGCDRHLFGLSMIAYQTGKSFELTNDPSWIKNGLFHFKLIFMLSGGNSNFLSSTSYVSFSVSVGGTSPMCLNTYGVFYRIGSDASEINK